MPLPIEAKSPEEILTSYKIITGRIEGETHWPTPVNIPTEEWIRSSLASVIAWASASYPCNPYEGTENDKRNGYNEAISTWVEILEKLAEQIIK